MGLGVTACKITRVTDAMFQAAAQAVASGVTDDALKQGQVFPALTDIRNVSLDIAVAISEVAFKENLTTLDQPADLRSFIEEQMYSPEYD